MYSFQANAGRRKNKQTRRLLYVVIFVLVIALAAAGKILWRKLRVPCLLPQHKGQ